VLASAWPAGAGFLRPAGRLHAQQKEQTYGRAQGLRNARHLLGPHARARCDHVSGVGQQRLAFRVSPSAIQGGLLQLLRGGHMGGGTRDPPGAPQLRACRGPLCHAYAGGAARGVRTPERRPQGHQRPPGRGQGMAQGTAARQELGGAAEPAVCAGSKISESCCLAF